jgi:small subunit ribosomal protein S4
MKLFLKGTRCFSDKCAIEKRAYPPGQHGKRRVKIVGYGHQLREKQKVKRIYGVLERQFRRYFKDAARRKGVTGHVLLQNLERRLDTVCVRVGFAPSQASARQLVGHGHVRVDGRRVDIPSFRVRAGQVIELDDKMRKNLTVQESLATASGRSIPEWLEFDAPAFDRGALLEVVDPEHRARRRGRAGPLPPPPAAVAGRRFQPRCSGKAFSAPGDWSTRRRPSLRPTAASSRARTRGDSERPSATPCAGSSCPPSGGPE